MYFKNYYYNHCSDLLFLSSAKLKLNNMFKKCICQKCTCPKNYLIPVFNKVCDIVSFPIKNVNKLISTACVSTFNFLSKSKFIYCKTFFFFLKKISKWKNLRYKTITSQNLSSEVQVANFFISKKSYENCSILKILNFFLFSTMSWFTKCVTSWSVLVHETRCIFEYIFWTTTH